MKIGSLVECIDNSMFSDLVKLNEPYTVREIINIGDFVPSLGRIAIRCDERCIRLEELSPEVKAYGVCFPDMPFPMNRFRELLPPMENIEELINENTIVIQPELV